MKGWIAKEKKTKKLLIIMKGEENKKLETYNEERKFEVIVTHTTH